MPYEYTAEAIGMRIKIKDLFVKQSLIPTITSTLLAAESVAMSGNTVSSELRP